MNVSLDWNDHSLAEGLECYNTGRYFEAHEHWESVWLTLERSEKSFLQALVQITAAMHHLSNGNSVGAASLMRRSLDRLSQYNLVFGGINVELLRQELFASLEAIRRGTQPHEITPPDIQPMIARPD